MDNKLFLTGMSIVQDIIDPEEIDSLLSNLTIPYTVKWFAVRRNKHSSKSCGQVTSHPLHVRRKSLLFNSISLSKIVPAFGSDSVIKNGAVLDLNQFLP